MCSNCYRLILAFGSNLGNLENNFEIALGFLFRNDPSFKILQKSSLIKTSPFQNTKQPDYLNFVCECLTTLHPIEFYQKKIVPIEDQLGHSRINKWASRALDIDILLSARNDGPNFEQCSPVVIESENFSTPHKRFLDPERKILQNLTSEIINLSNENIQCHFTRLKEKN